MAATLSIDLRTQQLGQDGNGRNQWQQRTEAASWSVDETALLLCDVWNNHHCVAAVERLEAMIPRMSEVVTALRDRGVQIIHAPSDTMEFYEGTPARMRVLDAPEVIPPPDLEREDPPQPCDKSDSSDTPTLDRAHFDSDKENGAPWTRQHPGIDIDQQRDAISDHGPSVYSFMEQSGIENVLIMGVHTNMCVLNRTFAIKQMVRWGKQVALIRDLTDAMYNPARAPYVSHDEGTQLIIAYIEKFWCPTTTIEDILNCGNGLTK